MPHHLFAKDLTKPSVLREQFLVLDDASSIEPFAAVKANDGGFFLAGGAKGTAWAGKIDANGGLLWNHFVDFIPWPLRPNVSIFYPEFHATAAMPDGSAYFCGFMTRPPGGYSPGLLTRLDAQGRVLNEQLLLPSKRSDRGIARFDDCVQWGDGLAMLGHIVDFPPAINGVFPAPVNSYWLLLLDAAGNVTSETQIASMSQLIEFGPLLLVSNSGLVFSATDNVNTEVVRVNKSWQMLAKKNVPGRFKLARPVAEDKIVQLFGNSDHNDRTRASAITLDDKLNEVQRVEGADLAEFNPYLVYRMPDQSFILFGSAVHKFGERYSSSTVHLNPMLTSEQSLEFPYNRSPPLDFGFVKAAAPTGSAATFLAARTFFIYEHSGAREHLPPRFKRGAALDFVLY